MSDASPATYKGAPVVFVKDGKTNRVLLGYTFRHRRTGRVFRFAKQWERALPSEARQVVEAQFVHLDGKRVMTYCVCPPWEVQYLNQQDAVDEARRTTMQFLQDLLPPGAEIHIRIKMPEPAAETGPKPGITVHRMDDLLKGDPDVG